VAPGVRGQGVGTRLLQRLLDTAVADRVPALSLSVESDNPAIRLYERVGFARVGAAGDSVTMLHVVDTA
jgi:ribosomal protein S18 acetylase RimI-like enzyme